MEISGFTVCRCNCHITFNVYIYILLSLTTYFTLFFLRVLETITKAEPGFVTVARQISCQWLTCTYKVQLIRHSGRPLQCTPFQILAYLSCIESRFIYPYTSIAGCWIFWFIENEGDYYHMLYVLVDNSLDRKVSWTHRSNLEITNRAATRRIPHYIFLYRRSRRLT